MKGDSSRTRYRTALAALALVTGVVTAVAATDDGADGFCRKGPDPRPAGAPPLPQGGPTAAAGVWVTDIDGSHPVKVAERSWEAGGSPRRLQWLPDGQLVYDGLQPNRGRLNGRQGETTALPLRQDAAWSRDGRRIAFVDNGIVAIERDGSGRRQLTTFDGSEDMVSGPEWSPDGRRIVFSADSMPDSSVERLEVIDADGTDRRVLLQKHGPAFLGASWSPDGREITFAAVGGYYGTWIGIVRPDGAGYRRIARHCAAQNPEWSPDGSTIIYNDAHGVVLIGADGSNMRRIENAWDGYSPVWSPDAKKIAFLRF